ncbi:protein adenylyltransferase SelO [Pseudaquidulcibacter saccharophilus]|uniref:protein adenylyltransferase SelO n=1 Tax=Pseudaquidulcibacter saccharophilus TaxID=2831900 RepID=UPI001EFF5C7D|nr:YdiU family protein [Pseudaquidulcibacter saccharophilus]
MPHKIINFDNSYINLPEIFYAPAEPTQVRGASLVRFNHALADFLNIDIADVSNHAIAELFSGNIVPNGAEPIAQAYGGHQFGHFNILGDGRAILLGETIAKDNQRYDIQLKGAGQTAFSRNGDGRAALGPVLREYLVSEFMNALNIPTTRALCFVKSGEKVQRETALDGAILTRIAKSHIRFGTFQYIAAMGNEADLKTLADYVINRHFSNIENAKNKYLELLKEITKAHAKLVANWMSIGFIHGVMNTDNASICGITIDYGPCAFMDNYNPQQVYSFIDKRGRYRYENQPNITQWNLARLAESLLPLIDNDSDKAIAIAEQVIIDFMDIYKNEYYSLMRAKLGLQKHLSGDDELVDGFLDYLSENNLDFTNSFRDLSKKINEEPYNDWYANWQKRLCQENNDKEKIIKILNQTNPAIIMRNHNIERAINAAYQLGDYTLFNEMLLASQAPFEAKPEYEYLTKPPRENEIVQNTFCGT